MLFLVVPKCQVKKILVSKQEDFNQKWKQGFLCWWSLDAIIHWHYVCHPDRKQEVERRELCRFSASD